VPIFTSQPEAIGCLTKVVVLGDEAADVYEVVDVREAMPKLCPLCADRDATAIPEDRGRKCKGL